MEPRTEKRKNSRASERRGASARRGTPVRNGLLLLILLAAVAALVALLPKQPVTKKAAILADGGEAATVSALEKPTLAITEVMSSNKSAYPDETGAYPDWVEITNTGMAAQSLRGMGLSDRDDRVLFIFPEMTLEAGARVVVFCDGTNKSQADEALHARFKISSLGETVYLFNGAGEAIDSVEVPALQGNQSYALTANGWQTTDQYTPGYENTQAGWEQSRSISLTAADGLVINEVLASNLTSLTDEDGDHPDWIELYNGTGRVVDLSNYALSDDPNDRVQWRFPKGVSMQPGEYLVVFASGKNRTDTTSGSRLHTNFRLKAEGETILLCDILGQVVDTVTYDNLPKDKSWARIEGLDYQWQECDSPTPGLPNNRSSQIQLDLQLRASNTRGVFISEVMSSSTGVDTPYGKSSYDWIELYNAATVPVSLDGWWLSDNPNHPRKCQLSNVTVPAGGYLVVFASGLTASPSGRREITHVPMRLSALGDTVLLSDPSGALVDKLVVPQLETDVSYGRDFDHGGLFYYTETTAGTKNGAGFSGYAAQPTMDKAGGTYSQQVTVTLSAPEGVTIRYTTDGSEPTEENGQEYAGPITLTKSAALRARGFKEGLRPSNITTATFLLNVYHSLPILCLTCDPDDLYNDEDGILAAGTAETFDHNPPFKKATYWKKTPHAGNFEYFTADGKSQLNQGVELQLNGQYSMDQAQKSWRVTAKAKYGGATLNYPFFRERPYTSYHSLVLRNGGQDGKYTRIIDALQARIVGWTDSTLFTMAYEPVIVYLNGEYWGQYNLRERINKYSIADYEGWSDPEKVDLIKGNNQVISGTYDNYKALKDFVRSHNLAEDPEALQTVLDWVDVDNYFDFMIFEIYFGNTDAGNIKFYRRQAEGEKWRWCMFDMDWGYFMSNTNGCKVWLDPKGAGDKDFDNWLILALLEVPEMKEKFLTRFGQLFQETLSDTDRIWAEAQKMAAVIQPELLFHYNRWSSENNKWITEEPTSPEANYTYWESRMKRLNNVLKKRPNLCWGYIRDWFGMTDAEMERYFGPQPVMPDDVQ